MKRFIFPASVLALAALIIAGCSQFGGTGVTVTGTVSGLYFGISSDVTVTIARGGVTLSEPVPVVSSSETQIGAFLIANIPPGDYSVEVTFEAGSHWVAGTTYSVNNGSWVPVDDEVITGDSTPYTYTITIDNLPIAGDETIDIDFGDVG
jgi:hypothetical protein